MLTGWDYISSYAEREDAEQAAKAIWRGCCVPEQFRKDWAQQRINETEKLIKEWYRERPERDLMAWYRRKLKEAEDARHNTGE